MQVILAVHLLRPVDQRQHVTVGNRHTLRLARGTGGVNHIGQVRRLPTVPRVVLRIPGKRVATGLHQHDLGITLRQLLQQAGLGQQDLGLAVFKHVGHTVLRVIRVQRHIGATGLEYRQQGNHQLAGARHRHTHPDFRRNTQLDQPVRQLVGPRIELGVTQDLLARHQGQGIRLLLGARFDQMLDTRLIGKGRTVGIPIVGDQLRFADAE
ncbi:hypothetical protein [Pseudomonas sp. 25 R 14]|nr:hypothetical protein [Pseudomonas sp. 25 R 14]